MRRWSLEGPAQAQSGLTRTCCRNGLRGRTLPPTIVAAVVSDRRFPGHGATRRTLTWRGSRGYRLAEPVQAATHAPPPATRYRSPHSRTVPSVVPVAAVLPAADIAAAVTAPGCPSRSPTSRLPLTSCTDAFPEPVPITRCEASIDAASDVRRSGSGRTRDSSLPSFRFQRAPGPAVAPPSTPCERGGMLSVVTRPQPVLMLQRAFPDARSNSSSRLL